MATISANNDDGDLLVPMGTKAQMQMAPMATMVPMALMAIVIVIGTAHRITICINGTSIGVIGVIDAIGAIGAIVTDGSPSLQFEPLSPLAHKVPLSQMNRHCRQWYHWINWRHWIAK